MNTLPASDALATARHIRDALPKQGLFAGMEWRVSPAPFSLPPALGGDLDKLGHRLWKFLRACDLLYRQSVKGTMPGWISRLLDAGKPPELVELSRRHGFLGQLPSVIRPDVILTDNGYVLSEIDSVPGGIGLLAWLNLEYTRAGCGVLGGAEGMLDGFAKILGTSAQILVSREAASYRPEMDWLAERLTASGRGKFSVLDAENAPGVSGRAYRFFELFDLPNLPGIFSLLERAASGEVFLTAPPKPYLEEKLWFALFWLRPLEAFWIRELGSGIFRELRKCIPRTWILDPTPLPPLAAYPGLEIQSWEELKHFTQKQRQFVIKVSGFSELAWGARGVHVGHDLPSQEWQAAVDAALQAFPASPHILQEFHSGAVFEVPALSGDASQIEIFPARARICPYYFSDGGSPTLGGALATLCPSDKKILHGMRDAVLCPCSV